MNVIFGIVLQAAGAFILTASAQSPAAVVEEIQGSVLRSWIMSSRARSFVSAPTTGSCSAI